MRSTVVSLLALAGGVAVVAGCQAALSERVGDRAARIPGSDTFIGASVEGDRVDAYVCDGTGDQLNVGVWLETTLSDDRASVSGDGVTLEIVRLRDTLEVQVGGVPGLAGPATVALRPRGAPDGLHVLDDGDNYVIWIIQGDEARGTLRRGDLTMAAPDPEPVLSNDGTVSFKVEIEGVTQGAF
jgi:hypothetical protein